MVCLLKLVYWHLAVNFLSNKSFKDIPLCIYTSNLLMGSKNYLNILHVHCIYRFSKACIFTFDVFTKAFIFPIKSDEYSYNL